MAAPFVLVAEVLHFALALCCKITGAPIYGLTLVARVLRRRLPSRQRRRLRELDLAFAYLHHVMEVHIGVGVDEFEGDHMDSGELGSTRMPTSDNRMVRKHCSDEECEHFSCGIQPPRVREFLRGSVECPCAGVDVHGMEHIIDTFLSTMGKDAVHDSAGRIASMVASIQNNDETRPGLQVAKDPRG